MGDRNEPVFVTMTRELNVDWMLAYAELIGAPLKAGRALASGELMDRREVALAVLHRYRLSLGSPNEIRASRQWLDDRGLVGPRWGPPFDAEQIRNLYANHDRRHDA